MRPRRQFAFLFHARFSFREEAGLFWPPLRHLPERLYEKATRELSLPPITFSRIFLPDDAQRPAGWMIILPTNSRQMLKDPREARAKIDAAIARALELGASIVGLGALTSPVTRGGTMLEQRQDIAITNGNAFTALMTYQAVLRLLKTIDAPAPNVALVGATGSVGSCVARLLGKHGGPARLTLVARTRAALDALASEIRDAGSGCRTDVEVSTDMDAVRDADLVVLLTSAAEAVLRSSHLKPRAVVLDDTQPRNTDPALQKARPDVRIVDGGVVSVPGLHMTSSLGLPHGCVYACMAETMLLALDGHDGHFCLGNATLEQAEHTLALAAQYQHLGFNLAPLRSFGRRLGADTRIGAERRFAA
jgi:predicted amino acid dehydrogenase